MSNADGLMVGPESKPVSLSRPEFIKELAAVFPKRVRYGQGDRPNLAGSSS
jgi:hypothetical protein